MDTTSFDPEGVPIAMDGLPDLMEPAGPMSGSRGDEMGEQQDGSGKAAWMHKESGLMLVEGVPESQTTVMLPHGGWTPVNPPKEDDKNDESLATRQTQCPPRTETDKEEQDSVLDEDEADQVQDDDDDRAATIQAPKKPRRTALSDKAGVGLEDPDDDRVQLIDRLVDPTNLRKGYARMKGKTENELPASLKKMSQIDRQQAQLNDAAVTELIRFNPAIRKQFKCHFDRQGRLFKKHFPLLQQTKLVGKEEIPLFDLDTKISNYRDYAKTAAFVNQPNMVTSGGQVRKRRPKRVKDVRDDKGVFIRNPSKAQSKGSREAGKQSDKVTANNEGEPQPEVSEETIVKQILNLFTKLEDTRKKSGRKELKTKHELIRQVAELQNESNFKIHALIRERARIDRKNSKLMTKNSRLRKLAHKLRTELDEMREDAGLSACDASDVSGDSTDERHMKKYKANDGQARQRKSGQSGAVDSDDDSPDDDSDSDHE